MTAAAFALTFANDMVGYYSVAADDTATVRDHPEKGRVTFAYASSAAISGKLCRVSFKALKAGSVDFTLHISQAADAEKKLLTDWSDHSLTVKLGREDVEAASGVSRTDGTTLGTAASDLSTGEDDGTNSTPDFLDLRKGDSTLKWILLGAGIPILIGVPVWLGVLIGRSLKDKAKKAEEKPGEPLPEPDAPSVTDADQNDNE